MMIENKGIKIAFISDIHNNHYNKHVSKLYSNNMLPYKKVLDNILPEFDEFDVLVLAGDISDNANDTISMISYLQEKLNPKPVLFISGNHDRVGMTFEESENIFKINNGYLNRVIKEINGYRFLGCTLWYNPELKDIIPPSWFDFRYIKNPIDIENEHKLDFEFLKDNMKDGDIIITHMLPLENCIDLKYKKNILNKYFISDCSEILTNINPLLWIHGHSHQRFWYRKSFDSTLFIRNPFGYPQEEFQENLIKSFVILEISNNNISIKEKL